MVYANNAFPYHQVRQGVAGPYYWPLQQNGWGGQTYAYGNPQYEWAARPQWEWKDYGGKPFVINIEQAAKYNQNYRTAIWTGKHLQVTLMSIDVGADIGLEVHPETDQFIRIEQGQGIVQMGKSRDQLDFVENVYENSAIMIPAGTWHNVTNTGNIPLKLYSIYAPPEHPFGTIQRTRAEAMAQHQ